MTSVQEKVPTGAGGVEGGLQQSYFDHNQVNNNYLFDYSSNQVHLVAFNFPRGPLINQFPFSTLG